MRLNVPEMLSHVELTKKDCLRILPNLQNWTSLSTYYADMTKEELEKHIIVELNYRRRQSLLSRMMVRYATRLKESLKTQVENEISKETNNSYFVDMLKKMERREDNAA